MTVYLRRCLILVNLNSFELYKQQKQTLLDFVDEVGKSVSEEEPIIEENSDSKDPINSSNKISSEEINDLKSQITKDLQKIELRLSSEKLKKEADELLKSKSNFEKAKSLYTQILKEDPHNIKGWRYFKTSMIIFVDCVFLIVIS